uniref:adenosylcobinamide-GDP ribazoletransferase n=1 Tax=Phenylobacterium sp. TaxID=1871053 RepID=UPI002FDA2CA9
GGGWIPALLALVMGIALTGAFHEDGLADTADGLGGGQTPARRLEIMRDSRVGTYGVIALGLVLALKAAALAQMPPAAAALALISAHGLGRGASVLAMRLSPYAPDASGGKWKPMPQGVSRGEALSALFLAVWPLPFLVVLVGPAGPFAAVLTGLALAALLLSLARRLIGGHTGDVLGAVEQLFEAGFLLALAASLS